MRGEHIDWMEAHGVGSGSSPHARGTQIGYYVL